MFKLIKEQFFDIRREEWPRALALSAFFFLVIAIFWILKPIKKSVLINQYMDNPFYLWGMDFGGAETEQLAKVVNMVVVYGVVILFTLLARKFKRQQLVYIFCGILGVALLYFSISIGSPGEFDAWALYVFGDIFNSVMVVTFWAFTNDVNSPGQSKRLYGIIGLGGVIGGAVGAQFVQSFVEQEVVGRSGLLLWSIVALALIALIAWYVNRRAGGADGPAAARAKGPAVNAAVEGARMVFKSKYLLAILGIIGLYEVVSNIVEFQLSAEVELSDMAGTEIDSFFGLWGWLLSIVSILAQLFLTPYMMNKQSIGAALFVLPLFDLIFSGGFLLFPTITMVLILSSFDNGLNYSINQSAKEALYTVTSRDAKYKAKAFIDMFIQRGAKVVAVGINLVFVAWVALEAVQWLSVAAIIVLMAWLAVVRFAGRRFKEEAEAEEESVPV